MAGIFSFSTRVTDFMDDVVHLEHSLDIRRHQRRKYYRREEYLPVFVKPSSAAAIARAAFLTDLGGGGASLQNPGRLLKQGDLLEVSFSPSMGKLTLAARVRRVSDNGRMINVEFVSLSETERNRIMSFILNQSPRVGIGSI
jgi:c-di-GMP-binding flagellar brake protein YcgR